MIAVQIRNEILDTFFNDLATLDRQYSVVFHKYIQAFSTDASKVEVTVDGEIKEFTLKEFGDKLGFREVSATEQGQDATKRTEPAQESTIAPEGVPA